MNFPSNFQPYIGNPLLKRFVDFHSPLFLPWQESRALTKGITGACSPDDGSVGGETVRLGPIPTYIALRGDRVDSAITEFILFHEMTHYVGSIERRSIDIVPFEELVADMVGHKLFNNLNGRDLRAEDVPYSDSNMHVQGRALDGMPPEYAPYLERVIGEAKRRYERLARFPLRDYAIAA